MQGLCEDLQSADDNPLVDELGLCRRGFVWKGICLRQTDGSPATALGWNYQDITA